MVTRRTRKREIQLTILVAGFGTVVGLAALTARAADSQPLTERQKIIHVLNRLGYGPRPGDVERIEKMGLQKYLQLQLHPERIDDSALRADLTKFDILTMDASELSRTFREEQQAQKERQREQAAAAKKGGTETNGTPTSTSTNQTQRPANRQPNADNPRRS